MLRLLSPLGRRAVALRSPLEREMDQMMRLADSFFQTRPWADRDFVSRETATHESPVTRQPDGSYKLELYVDAGGAFKPGDIKVSTKDGALHLSASAEHKDPDSGFFTSRSFARSVPLPAGVEKEKLTAKLTEEGGILVEAPVAPPKDAPQEAIRGEAPLSVKHE